MTCFNKSAATEYFAAGIRLALLAAVLTTLTTGAALACDAEYVWERSTEAAAYPTGYNYPVFMFGGEMVAFRNASFRSSDGRSWHRTGLPDSGLNSAFQKYVKLGDAVYALGTMRGNSESMTLGSRIMRTRDGEKWEVVAERSNLPKRVFYAAAAYRDKIWIFGGSYDGRRFADVWNSSDAVNWTRVSDRAPWGETDGLHAVVFKGRVYLIGTEKVWSTADGVDWRLETDRMASNPVFVGGYSAAVFDGRIWLVGINRNGTFRSGVLCSEDGRKWRESDAPWSPRGAVAAWVANDRLFMTGGKSSYVENGETKFVYSNDVWTLRRRGAGSPALAIGLAGKLF